MKSLTTEQKKSLAWWQFCGFCTVSLLGTLLHFLFDWSKNSLFVAPFSAVNESTWEHMKIYFFPALLFAVIQSRYTGKQFNNFWCVKLIGIIIATISIPVIFYTANGAFGKTPDWVNIIIFFIANAIGFVLEFVLFQKSSLSCKRKWLPILIFIIIAILFVIFTFFTPRLPLFLDPLSGSYGI